MRALSRRKSDVVHEAFGRVQGGCGRSKSTLSTLEEMENVFGEFVNYRATYFQGVCNNCYTVLIRTANGFVRKTIRQTLLAK